MGFSRKNWKERWALRKTPFYLQNHLQDYLNRCWFCGREFGKADKTRDHLKPRSRGGGGKGNLVPSCALCNRAKGPRTLEEYRRLLGGGLFYAEQMELVARKTSDILNIFQAAQTKEKWWKANTTAPD